MPSWMERAVRRTLPFLHRVPVRDVRGAGNVIRYAGATLLNVTFDVRGDRNEIVIAPGAFLRGVRFHIRGSGHRVYIGERVRISVRGQIWMEDRDGELRIGRGTTLVSGQLAVTEPGSRLIIGEDCMLATEVEIRTGDSHAILDARTGERINPAQDVVLEDHVWVGARAMILKGCTLGRDSIVAAGAVVTRSCPPRCIVAGNPARVVREGVTWRRARA